MKEKKELLVKIISMSIEECIEREKYCQKMKRKTAHKYYAGNNLIYKNPDYTFENYRVEQIWLRMRISGMTKELKGFVENQYKFS